MAKYATSVGSNATQLKDISATKNATNNTISNLAYRHDYPFTRNMSKTAMNSHAALVHQIYNYAEKEYTYGLPNGFIVNRELVDTDALKTVIEADLGFEIDIQVAFIDSPNDLMFARAYATEHWGFILDDTNEGQGYMTNPPVGRETSRSNGIASGHQSTVLRGETIKDGRFEIDISLDYIPERQEDNRTTPAYYKRYTITKQISELTWKPDLNEIFYHVRYVPKGQVDVGENYWFYEVGKGTYPELDDISTDRGQPFMPVIPLRMDNKNLGPEFDNIGTPDIKFKRNANGDKIFPDTELYRTSKKLLKKSGVNMDDVCKLIHENDQVGDIDDCYITYAIDIRTETKEGKKYIYQFFRELALSNPNKSELKIEDGNYKVHIKYDNASLVTKTGSISNDVDLIYTNNGDILTIRKKLSETEYEEIVVTNLLHVNYIYRRHNETTSIEDSADDENFGFLIPLQYNLIKEDRSLFGRQDLLDESLVLIFNCYERRKLKWYETGFFKFLVIVVAVALAIWTGGASLFFASLATAISGGILSTIIFIATTVGVGLLIQEGLKLAVEYLGPEWAAVLAVVVSIVAIGTGQFGLATESFALLSVDGLLAAISGIAANLSTVYGAEMELVQDELEDFNEQAKKELDELAALEDELRDVGFISLDSVLTRPHQDMFGETPDEFYNRTIHTNNVGVSTYDLLHSYYDIQLSLPELKKTK